MASLQHRPQHLTPLISHFSWIMGKRAQTLLLLVPRGWQEEMEEVTVRGNTSASLH